MFTIGDHVIFTRDGTKGIVVEVQNNRCQIIWEDHFVSWENSESLQKDNQS